MAEAFFAYYKKQQQLEKREARLKESQEKNEAKQKEKEAKEKAKQLEKEEREKAKLAEKREKEEAKKREREEEIAKLKEDKKKEENQRERKRQKRATQRERRAKEKVKQQSTASVGVHLATPSDPETAEFLKFIEEQVRLEPLPTKLRPSGAVADWDDFLMDAENLYYIPPVHFFKHAPLANIWQDLAKVDLVVEVPNVHVSCSRPVYWYAEIQHYAGYYALIEYEGLGIESAYAGWMSFCSGVPKEIGFCDRNRILLHPPYKVRDKVPDCFKKAKALYQNSATVAEEHGEFIYDQIKKLQIYKVGDHLEAMDREELHRNRVGKVVQVIGDRIHVEYVLQLASNDPISGFWFSIHSSEIHPLGWSHEVGQEIYWLPVESPFSPLSPDCFTEFPENLQLKPGQLFETRHPTMPYKICVAEIVRVLRHGYFVCEIVTCKSEKSFPLRFTYHFSSPYVLPIGFCEFMNIHLVPRYLSEDQDQASFNWNKYLDEHGEDCVAPFRLLPERPNHRFKPGMKMEMACTNHPTYIGPSTVRRVRGHLLYVSYDGWPKNSADPPEVWVDAESPDIYPVGYCGMVAHEFNGRAEHPSVREDDFPRDEDDGDDEDVEDDDEDDDDEDFL